MLSLLITTFLYRSNHKVLYIPGGAGGGGGGGKFGYEGGGGGTGGGGAVDEGGGAPTTGLTVILERSTVGRSSMLTLPSLSALSNCSMCC